jgi:hypothetical protein
MNKYTVDYTIRFILDEEDIKNGFDPDDPVAYAGKLDFNQSSEIVNWKVK